MKVIHVVLTVLLAALTLCSLVHGFGSLKSQKCGKIISGKFSKVFGRTAYCRRLCRSFPLKTQPEPDGTPCWSLRGRGECLDGRCRPLTSPSAPPRSR
ncbi:uncharacterized protein LOC144144993 [Haemaphysalis longicornis]